MRIPIAAAVSLLFAGALPAQEGKPVRVLTTTTDLAALVREVGGDAVKVDCLTTGPEDAHFLDARPSFVRLAHDADLFVKIGMDLEAGYEVPIVRDARNPRIQPGTPGHLDASVGVDRLEVPTGTVDRSLGDVHPQGNPHYLADPVRAKGVAAAIAESLAQVDPPRADRFRAAAGEFAKRVDEAMFGREVLAEAPARRLERLLARGELAGWLKERELEGKIGGFAAALLPHSGTKVVQVHGHFSYLLDRFHLPVAANLEPKPGIPPSPGHARTVVETIRAARIPAILRTVFNAPAGPDAVAAETGARVVVLAHRPGALGEDRDYLAFVDRNVRLLAAALGARR
ncbi:MAG TPA: metal ABC transporter substrate-binding protein [Planctomycetota bacterium]|nr:metal ABC transporter substrate-binding protein [Planctomycetota bacterium]